MFCDLVGSTALQTSLGDDAADPIRRSIHGVLREAAERCEGQEVKNLGDGIMAVFPSAADAVDCAIAMQQGVGRLGDRLRLDLALRVGVSAGEATQEGGDWFGTAVIEAARLCGRAEAGQVLVSAVAHSLVASRRRHTFRSVGALELKGLPEALPAYEATWEPGSGDEAAEPAPPSTMVPRPEFTLSERLRVTPPFGFFGRVEEQAVLASAWKEAEAGRRRVVLVSGEPGVGKTGLVAKLARRVHAEQGLVLYGRCDEDLGLPYQPFIEALRGCLMATGGAGLSEWARNHGESVARLVPELPSLIPDVRPLRSLDPETERYLLFQAISSLLGAASRQWPVLLVLDDLHWAAKPTLLLLKHVVTSVEPMALLVMGTFRESDLSRDHPLTELLAELRREPAVERVSLRGLDDDDVVALVERASRQALNEETLAFAHAIGQETDGNPFFLTEILRHLAETGAVARQRDGWVAARDLTEVSLPTSVREVIGHRVRRLGDEASRVLSVAAVIGREFDLDLLAVATEAPEERLLDLLDEARTAALVAEVAGRPGRFTFSHALIQHALYEDLPGVRRVRAHQRVASALEDLCGDEPGERVAELAHHWIAATRPVSTAKAVDYAMRAGDRALVQLAPEEAVGWYDKAFELHDAPGGDDELQTELLIRLGEAQRQAGQGAFRETLLAAAGIARRRGDTDRLVRAALANNRGVQSNSGEVDEDRVAVLEAAVAALGDSDTAERALVLATLAVELTFEGNWQRRRALADEALAVARRVGEQATLVRVLNLRHNAVWVPLTIGSRLEETAENLELTSGSGNPVERFWALDFRLLTVGDAGPMEEADGLLAEMEALARRLGQPGLQWQVAFHRSNRELLAGRIVEADRFALEALQVGNDSGQPDTVPIYGAQLWLIRLHQGRLAELDSLLRQAVVDNPGLPVFRAFSAYTCAELGDVEGTARLLAVDAANGFADLPYDMTWPTALACYAEACSFIGDRSAAAVLAEKLRSMRGTLVSTGVTNLGATDRYLGLLAATLGRFDEAESYLAAATELHERIGARAWLARTQLDRAAVLLRRDGVGDSEESRRLTETALSTARELGLTTVEHRALALLG